MPCKNRFARLVIVNSKLELYLAKDFNIYDEVGNSVKSHLVNSGFIGRLMSILFFSKILNFLLLSRILANLFILAVHRIPLINSAYAGIKTLIRIKIEEIQVL